MGKFYFFDTAVSFSESYSSSYSQSAIFPDVNEAACYEGTIALQYMVTDVASEGSTRSGVYAMLSARVDATQNIGAGDSTGSSFSSRNFVTNPTYSYTHGTDASTATGGETLITTTTTTQSFAQKHTTTARTDFLFSYIAGSYKDSNGVLTFLTVENPSSIVTTLISSNYTISNIPTTCVGYHFAFRVAGVQALWHLEPWERTSPNAHRTSPAYSASTPWPSATSFSATAPSGTHALVTSFSTQSFTSSDGDSEIFVYSCPENAELETYLNGTSASASAGATAQIVVYDTSADSVSGITIQRPFLSFAPQQFPVTGTDGISGASLLASVSASPYSYSFDGKTVGVGLSKGMVSVSAVNGSAVQAPLYFLGQTTGEVGGSMATLSWINASSLTYTRQLYAGTTPTGTAGGVLSFATTATQASQRATSTYLADTNFHRPPLMRVTGTDYEPVESYGSTAGSYRIISTNSSGGTSSLTTSGTQSRTLGTSDYARPIRKEMSSYAYTTSSSLMDMTFASLNFPAFSGLYGDFYIGTEMSQMRVEEGVNATAFPEGIIVTAFFERTLAL